MKKWDVKNLGEVCTIQLGKTPHRKTERFWDRDKSSSNVWLSIADLSHGSVASDSKEYISDLGADKLKSTPKGCLMLSFKLTLGRVAFAGRNLYTNEAIASLVSLSPSILPQFLFYYFSFYDWDKATEGDEKVKGKTLNKAKLNILPIPIPPLSEQEEIVEVLDTAFAAIDQAKANIEQNIANANELFQSKLNQIFSQKGEGWVETTLGDIGTLTSSKRIFKKDYVSSGIPFYRSKEIKELAHGREISLELFITKERYEEIKNKFGIPQKGDILLTAVGTIGEMYVVKGHEEFYFKDGNLMWLKNFDTLDSYYLKYALTHFVDQLKAMSRGAAYSALTIEKLKKYSIPVPNDKIQREMVLLLDSFKAQQEQLIEAYQTKLASLDELKKSILQKAFAGELTN